MLTEEEKQEIITELGNHENKRAACFEAMRIVQRKRGWLSDDLLRGIAELLDMTAEELDSVATFYTFIFRKPVGRHVISICDSASCWIMGYEDLLSYLKSRLNISLGGTTEDGRFTLLPVSCLGACDHAPALMVDDNLHLDLTRDKIDEILDRYGD
jgi:NADH-quinone oxidoreductase subunit E